MGLPHFNFECKRVSESASNLKFLWSPYIPFRRWFGGSARRGKIEWADRKTRLINEHRTHWTRIHGERPCPGARGEAGRRLLERSTPSFGRLQRRARQP